MQNKRPCNTIDKLRSDNVDGFDIEVEGDFQGNLGVYNYKDSTLFSKRDKRKVVKEMSAGRTLFAAVKNVAGKSVKIRKCYLIEKDVPLRSGGIKKKLEEVGKDLSDLKKEVLKKS